MTWANLLSVLRVGLIPLFIMALLDKEPMKALIIFAVAGISDLLDGFIARYWQQVSKLGTYLDPAADKLLLTVSFVMLSVPDLHVGRQIPIWITVLVILRDVLIVVGALIIYRVLHYSKFAPLKLSKWNTAFQISAIVAILLTGVDARFDPLAVVVLYMMLALTVISGLEYAYRFVYRVGDLKNDA